MSGWEECFIYTTLSGKQSFVDEAEVFDRKMDNRTFRESFRYIKKNWFNLSSGDVIDVAYILGLTDQPVQSQFETDNF